MAGERVTHFDGEQGQERFLCVINLLSNLTLLEELIWLSLDASVNFGRFHSTISLLSEVYSNFVERAAWLLSSCGSTTPLESQQEFQQKESNILFANQGSFDSLFHNEFISTQSSMDEASCQTMLLYQKAFISMRENFYSTFSNEIEMFRKEVKNSSKEIEKKRKEMEKEVKKLSKEIEKMGKEMEKEVDSYRHLPLRGKPNSQKFICRTPSCTYNYYEHPGTRLHVKSCQNSQSQFSHKMWLLWKKKKKEKEKQTFLSSLKDITRSGLEYVRNVLELVSTTMHLLDDTSMPLNTIQDELLEWLKKIEQVSDRLLERLQRIHTQLFICAAIFFWLFKEFPNGIRHLCTTMPWTIWPALVVLWGVCWMFHSGPVLCAAVEAEPPLPLDQQEQLLNFQDDHFGNDHGIDLPDTALPDDSAAFPWEFWSDSSGATHDWGVIDQLVHIDEVAVSSNIPTIPTTITPSLTTILDRNEFLDVKQSTPGSLSSVNSLSLVEYLQQSSTNANMRRQTTGTSIRANRIHTRTQRGSLKCPDCDQSFTRSDSLRRHISAKHAKDREFLCSNSGCERSKKGQGFNRRDKWRAHENGTCKNRTWLHSSSSISIPSEAAPQLDSIASASLVRQESSGGIWIGDTEISRAETLQNQDVILELRRLCQTKKEALLIKERECEAGRKDIAHLSAVIKLLEGSSTTTSI